MPTSPNDSARRGPGDDARAGSDEARVRDTRRTYDRIAPTFLANTHDRSRQQARAERFAAGLPGRRVIDVGAGPGTDGPLLARLGLEVVSTDLSRGMLRVAPDAYPAPRVQCDMRALPFAAGSVAGIWANASLLHLPRRDAAPALAGFHRVLSPGGRLHLSVKHERGGREEGWESERYGAGAPRWFTYWTPDALDRLLAAARFERIEGEVRESTRDLWILRLLRRD